MNKLYSILMKSIKKGNPRNRAYVVDDISELHAFSRYNGTYYLVRLQRFGRIHEAKYLLVDRDLIEPEYRLLHVSPEVDRWSNLIAYGRGFVVNNEPLNTLPDGPNRLLSIVTRENADGAINRVTEIEDVLRMKYEDVDKLTAYNTFMDVSEDELADDRVKVRVFDVGQGDTIIIEFSDRTFWMIDAYLPSSQISQRVYDYLEYLQTHEYKFEAFVISHMHYDHIKNAHSVIRYYNPKNVIYADPPTKLTDTAVKVLNYAQQKSNLLRISVTTQYKNGMLCLYPTNIPGLNLNLADPNTHGIIATIETARSQMVLSGDVLGTQLENLINTIFIPNMGKSRYYKVTHHCSVTGNSQNFLQVYHPNESITSCGLRNSYGHPDNPPLDVLTQMGNHRFTHNLPDPYHTYDL